MFSTASSVNANLFFYLIFSWYSLFTHHPKVSHTKEPSPSPCKRIRDMFIWRKPYGHTVRSTGWVWEFFFRVKFLFSGFLNSKFNVEMILFLLKKTIHRKIYIVFFVPDLLYYGNAQCWTGGKNVVEQKCVPGSTQCKCFLFSISIILWKGTPKGTHVLILQWRTGNGPVDQSGN